MEFYRKFYKFVLSRRYKIIIEGLDVLKSDSAKLFLPNHVSHIDPQIMTLECLKYNDFVPVVAERFTKIPIVKFFLRKLNAIVVSDLKKGRQGVELLKQINQKVVVALKDGKSVIIFPSGQLSSGGIEKIFNKQSAFQVVSELPDNAKVIGVRIRGLWGSMWSKAWNGKRPVFLSTFLMGIVYWFANLIFLCPKRKIVIEFVDITEEAKLNSQSDRKAFNTYLEGFYNANGAEKPVFIRHLFFFPKIKNKVVV